jgi:pumilio RNA-binding family
VVQFALQVADVTAAVDVIADLRGHVVEAMQSPHGNYVIQKIVETLPVVHSSFIVEELRVMGAGAVARHRYGCRVVCRMLEHCASEEPATTFISEVLSEAGELCRHAFGHHVIQCIMEHALPGQRELIFDALCCELSRNVRNRNANFVIEKAFTCCSAEEQSNLVDKLLSCGEDLLAALAQSRVAPRLGRMLSGLPERRSSDAVEQLQLATGKLHGTKFGKLLLKSFGLGEALGGASSPLVVAAA